MDCACPSVLFLRFNVGMHCISPFLWYSIKCYSAFRGILSFGMKCKTASCLFYLFSPLLSFSLSLSLSFSDLSLVAGLFLLSPAMMAPHLAVGTMRNDKMGEPCFYLMGQNQTTVCSQKSAMIHHTPPPPHPTPRPPALWSSFSFDSLLTPSSAPPVPASFFVCTWQNEQAFCLVVPEIQLSTSLYIHMWKGPELT